MHWYLTEEGRQQTACHKAALHVLTWLHKCTCFFLEVMLEYKTYSFMLQDDYMLENDLESRKSQNDVKHSSLRLTQYLECIPADVAWLKT